MNRRHEKEAAFSERPPQLVKRGLASWWSGKHAPRAIARVGNADRSFSENSGKPEKLGTLIYGSQFRVLSGGSKWLSALPTGGSKWLSALPTPRQQVGAGSALPQLLRGTASDSLQTKNPEASIYGRRIRLGFGGSKWVQALPTRRQQVAVGPADRKSRLLNVWTLRKE